MGLTAGITLICAATGVEARACRAGIARAGLEARYEVLRTGMGPAAARAALAARLARGPRPRAIVSSGFAGSLRAALDVGAWARGRSVRDLAGARSELVPLPLVGAVAADFLSVSEPVDAAAHAGSDCVDMESHAWATLAARAGIPFAILRLISDSPRAPLPPAVRTLSALARAPSLIQLGRGLAEAAAEPRRLAGFLARGTRLPGELARGWAEFAPLLPE